MKVIVHGARGRMGVNIIKALKNFNQDTVILPVDISYKTEKCDGAYADIF